MDDQTPTLRADPDPAAREDVKSSTRDFGLLWTGQSVSLLGDQVMVVALPLAAVTVLGASTGQAALLPFAFKLPFLLLGLPVGAFLDRVRRRPVMLAAEAVQLICFALIGALAIWGELPFWLLMVLMGASGVATVFFQIAYVSYLPSLVTRPRALHRANARLQLSESTSRSLGPALAGPVIAVAGPVGAAFANAATFLVSYFAMAAIRHREPKPEPTRREKGWLVREIKEGLAFVVSHPLLEPILLCGAVYVMFQGVVVTIIVLYCLDVLHLGSVAIGLVVGAAALGYPIGNLVCTRLADRIGLVRTVVLGAVISVAGLATMPFTGSSGWVLGLVGGSIVHGIGEGLFGPTWTTVRQNVTPPALMSRVNSVERFVLWGAVPLSSLLAAALISLVGLPATLWVGGLGAAACLPPLLRRGVRQGLRRSTPSPEVKT